jgi:hypothetical protein
MRKILIGLSTFAIVFALAVVPALATKPASQGKSAAAKGAPKIKPASVKSSALQGKSAAPKAKAPTMKAAKAAKPTTAKAPNATVAKASKPGAAKKSTPGATTTAAGDVVLVPTVGGTWVPTNPVAQKLSTKPNLLSRIKNSLPLGSDLNLATVGFKNFGQFVAATNVSSNLGIDFWMLKSSMTGFDAAGLPTGQPTLSLGQSIQKLRTGVDGTAEARRAETLANQMIADSGN